jgi:peptide/nickel transport system ATP-binding protein
LLNSYLSLDNLNDIRVPDMKESPDQTIDTDKCRFAGSCAYANGCAGRSPDWIDISPTHKAFCCNPDMIRRGHGKS